MRRYPAGTRVRGGLYLDLRTGRAVIVRRRGGALEGAGACYVRLPLPTPLALVLAPLAGALYVIVLPFIGLGLLVGLLCRKLWGATGLAGAVGALTAGAHGRPGWAFLLGPRRAIPDGAPGDRAAGPEDAAGTRKAAKETK